MSDTYSAKATDFQPDPHNANEGTERGVYMVETSIEQNGLGRSIVVSADGVVLAGNKTLQAAIDAGLVEARVIETDGNELVVVKRTDLESGTPEAARYAIADNRTSEVGLEWDIEELQWADELGVELGDWWFENELARMGFDIEGEELDYDEMWKGMPEFEQDVIEPYYTIKVHFETPKALEEFANLLQQTVTLDTKYIYYPKQINKKWENFTVEDES